MKLSIEVDGLFTCATDIQAKAGDQVVIYQGTVLCVYKAPLIVERVSDTKETVSKRCAITLSVHNLTDAYRFGMLTVIAAHSRLPLRSLRKYAPSTFPEGCKAWMMALRTEGLLRVEASSHMTKRGTCYIITEKGKQFMQTYGEARK